jgi:hypothetical protein
MGTSASGGGAGNGNPLIPSWIPSGDGQPAPPPEDNGDSDLANEDGGDGQDNQAPSAPPESSPAPPGENRPIVSPYRYTAPRRQLNKFVSSGGTDRGAFGRALKGYSRNAAGSTSGLARRMAPSTIRIAGFSQAINSIRSEGLENTLARLNLTEYIGRPVVEVLAALTDFIFADDGAFHDTQDDSLTKQAYSNAIVRIGEMGDMDLNTLTNENIEVMTATFIEETIVQRVFTDIGNDITKKESDITKLIEIEEMAYQIVSGLVRNTIMPEIKAMQLGNRENLQANIENIYRIAFDTLSNIQD